MKKSLIIIIGVIIALSLLGFMAISGKINKTKIATTGNAQHVGMEDDAQDRVRWEIKRLGDPATGKIPDNIRQKELAFAATLPNDAQGNSMGDRAALTIVNRGPFNVGGRTRAFGVDIKNENRLLAGTPSGGMWLSTDGGTTWNMSNTVSQLKNATCLVQDKRTNHTNVWYYGSGEADGASAGASGAYYMGDGLFKSTDGGVTWLPIASTAGGAPQTFTIGWQLVWNLANDVSANDTASIIYAAIYGGIERSVNGGTTWTAVQGGNSYFTDVAVTTTGVVYTTLSDDGTSKGIWRSANGTAFTKITPPTFPLHYNRIVMGINPSNENEVYFLANTPGSGKVTYNFLGEAEWNSFWKYTYLSGNGDTTGGAWQDLSVNLPTTGGMFDKWTTQGSYDMVVRVKPNDPNTVFIGGTNLYRSITGFQDSTHTAFIGGYEQFSAMPVINSYLNHHPDQHGLEFLPSNPDIMFSTNDGGIFKASNNSVNGVVWQPLNNGYLTSMFYTVAIDHATPGNNIIIGGAQDNGSWFTNNTNVTSPWVHAHGGDGSYCAIADNRSSYYFSIQNCMRLVKATLDANGNTTAFARIDPIGGKGYQWMNPFALDPNNNNIMYLTGGKYLWRNNDLSAVPLLNTWDSISTNWVQFADSVPLANSVITALAVCKTPANRVYYGTDKKKIYRVDNANSGTPTPIDITSITSTALFPANAYVSNIAIDPTDGNKLMVIFSNYNVYSIYYSVDGGTTWSKQGGNLEPTNGSGPSIRWASIMPVADGMVYLVATSTGLYATDSLKSKGTTTVWVQQGANTIGNAVCDMIETRISDGLVVIATHANGIYSTNITSVNDIASVNSIAAANTDLQLTNYPNPMSQATTIEFTLNKKSNVNLQIWDECGRLMETLVNEAMQEGKHTVVFDKKNLKAGIYYYSLTAENRRKTNKMVIAK